MQEVCDQHAVTPRVRRLVGQAAVAKVWIVEGNVVVQPGRAHAQLRRGQSSGVDAVTDDRSTPLQLSRVGCSVSVCGDQLLGGGKHCRRQLDEATKGTLQRERVRKVAVAHDEDSARLNDRCICHRGFSTRCQTNEADAAAAPSFQDGASASPASRR